MNLPIYPSTTFILRAAQKLHIKFGSSNCKRIFRLFELLSFALIYFLSLHIVETKSTLYSTMGEALQKHL